MTSATTPLPQVPLPAGAEISCTWDDWDNKFRVVWTGDTTVVSVAGAGITVAGSAIQFLDGTIDPGAEGAPLVSVGAPQVTAPQARELAACDHRDRGLD